MVHLNHRRAVFSQPRPLVTRSIHQLEPRLDSPYDNDNEATLFLKDLTGRADFSPEKMAKITLAKGEQMFAGLNCFEPGQEHAPHAHAGQDKLYIILEGSAMVRVGEADELLSAGDAAFAPAGVLHGIRNATDQRLVVLAILSPPPK